MEQDGDSNLKVYRPEEGSVIFAGFVGLILAGVGAYQILTSLTASGSKTEPSVAYSFSFGLLFVAAGFFLAIHLWMSYRNTKVIVSDDGVCILDWRGREQLRESWSGIQSIQRVSHDEGSSLTISNGKQNITIPHQIAVIHGFEKDLRSRAKLPVSADPNIIHS